MNTNRDYDPTTAYGPDGWTITNGVWTILTPYLVIPTDVTDDGKPAGYGAHFQHLDAEGARRLRDALTHDALTDRQGDGATIGCLLNAAIDHPGTVFLDGYAVAPGEPWERVTVTELWSTDPQLLALPDPYDDEEQDEANWNAIVNHYHLDHNDVPETTCRMPLPWDRDARGWWLYWY